MRLLKRFYFSQVNTLAILTLLVGAIAVSAFSERVFSEQAVTETEQIEDTNTNLTKGSNVYQPQESWFKPTLTPVFGGSGQIIFGQAMGVGFNNEPSTTWTLDPSGLLLQPIANIDDFEASWSPDGTKIVFVSRRDGEDDSNFIALTNREIYIMNPDGTDQKRLTYDDVPQAQPSFSPDGTKIIYVGYPPDGSTTNSGIYTMNVDGTNQTLITEGNDCNFFAQNRRKNTKGKRDSKSDYFPGIIGWDTPNFSPDGTKIMFGSGYGFVFTVNADGTGCTTFYESDNGEYAAEARFSPDGTKVALLDSDYEFFEDPETGEEIEFEVFFLRIFNSDGSFSHNISAPQFFRTPVWSPDGTQLAYFGGDPEFGQTFAVWKIGVDVSSPQRLYFVSNQAVILNGLSWGIPSTTSPQISLKLDQPHPFPAGTSGQGTVKLDPSQVPAGGVNITLSIVDGSTAISLPNPVVFVPEGQTTATFAIDSVLSADYESVDIIAQVGTNMARATVSLSPARPDIEISDLTAPASASINTSFDISYKLKNIGAVATSESWIDRIYFSEDDNFNSGEDRFLTTHHNSAPLGVNEEVTPTVSISIPQDVVPADGTFYIFVNTNFGQAMSEGDQISNNLAVRSIQVSLPDLIAENLTVPANSEPNENYTFTWDVKNNGGATANSATRSVIYFSQDNVAGNADDVFLDSEDAPVLDAGETVQQSAAARIQTTPVRPSGESFFYVRVDVLNGVYEGTSSGNGETNNNLFASTQFEYNVPDLQVTSTTADTQLETDVAFALGWTDTNAGNKAASGFADRVYFSLDDQVGADVLLGTFPLSQNLDGTSSVERIQNVSIPTGSITQSGDYFLYVRSDSGNTVDEGENEDNNVRFHPVFVTRLERPDLEVTNITAPDSAFFSQRIQVQWTVTNNGPGPTNSPSWKDRLYVGTNPNSTSGASFLADSSNISYLNVGESYIASATVEIPRGLNGSYHFIVQADRFDQVPEDDNANNLLSRPVTLNVPPLPDYTVTNVQAPEQAFAGAPIEITWEVKNQGDASNGRDANGNFIQWRDSVYISRDTTLTIGANGDRRIHTTLRTGEFEADTTYSDNTLIHDQNPRFVNLPNDIEGEWYVFVVTDAFDNIYEFTNENNNTEYDQTQPGSPMNVLVTPPDLVIVGQPNAPTSATGGESVAISYTSKNQGAFPTSSAWRDRLYLSDDTVFSNDDVILGSSGVRNGLAAGAEETIELTVQIPNCLTGTYFIIAVTDSANQVFEFDANIDAEANNTSVAAQIQLTANPADLQVTNFTVPAITQPGQSVAVSYTAANTGEDTIASGWTDRIVLVSNSGLPTQVLAQLSRQGSLQSGASYTINQNVQLPSYMNGEYYLSIQLDSNSLVEECEAEGNNSANSSPFTVSNNLPDLQISNVVVPTTAQVGGSINVEWTGINNGQAMSTSGSWFDRIYLSTNDTLSSDDRPLSSVLLQQMLAAGGTYQQQNQAVIPNTAAGSYYIIIAADADSNFNEGPANSTFETNNTRASIPLTITSPGVDLQASNVSVTTPTYSANLVDVSWTVTNAGAEDTLTDSWSDQIYLSRDSVVDSNDIRLGFQRREALLAGGTNYQVTKSVRIPNGLTGDYNILVHTDYRNEVAENDDDNNVGVLSNVNITLPPPADLNITNISVPSTINLDNLSAISWTIQNSGPNTALGTWRDSVYLSRDQFWDASDILVGQKERETNDLNVTETYTTNLLTTELFVEEGDYYVIVRTDARNSVRESNEANNVSTSVAQTSVEITELPMNTNVDTTLTNGFRKVFKFMPPPMETVIVSLLGESGNSNELFTNFDSVVSRADYDYQGSEPGQPNQENVIPETGDGTYYSLVSNDFIPNSFAEAFDKTPAEFKEKSANRKARKVNLGGTQIITVKAEVLPFSVRKISPTKAGNEGLATVRIDGAKFQEGASAKLVADDGSEIFAGNEKNSVNRVAAIFDFRGKTPGLYDVVVTNPDSSSETLENGFEIIDGGGFSLRGSIVGPSVLSETATSARYSFSVANDGLNDAVDVPVLIQLSGEFDYQIDEGNIIDVPVENVPFEFRDFPMVDSHIDVDGKRVIVLFAPIVRSKSTLELNINVQIPLGIAPTIGFGILPPLSELGNLSPNDIPSNLASFNADDVDTTAFDLCLAELARQIAFLIRSLIPGGSAQCQDAVVSLIAFVTDLTTGTLLNIYATGGTGETGSVITTVLPRLFDLAGDAALCAGTQIPHVKLLSAILAIELALNQAILCLEQYYILEGRRISSFDPNEKIGPLGYGPEKFVGLNQPLLYRINFENVAEASAPAQRINIIDQLPPTLDPRTVRLREIGFKQNRFIVPENQAFYQERVQLGEDLGNLKADITAGLDIANGRIFWTITAIDPQTGERPTDPLEGILPPNNENFDGEGYVTFTIEPTDGLANRMEISNLASIIFDENEAIITNTTSNILDNGVPTSSVATLPATTESPTFNVDWSGGDEANGSGFDSFDVYVSEDGGGYLPAFSNTTATNGTFTGEWGKEYRFYSIAKDNAGNVEMPPNLPDAVIKVFGGDTEGDLASRPNGSDGTVDASDAVQSRRFAAKLDTDFNYNEYQRADTAPFVNKGNGSLTVADVVQTRRFIETLDPLSQANGPNAATSLAPNSKNNPKSLGPARTIRPVGLSRIGNTLRVAIEIDSQGDEVGVGFTLNFDPAILSNPTNIQVGGDATGATVTSNASEAAQGRLGILVDNAPTQPFAAGTRQILTLEFDVSLTAPLVTEISFSDSVVKQEVVDGNADPVTASFTAGTIRLLAPTAANASIGGKILNEAGRGIPRAFVTVIDANGDATSIRANQFGYYRIEGLEAGESYLITVRSKGYSTLSQLINVDDDMLNLNFTLTN